jgi:xylulokinase
MILSIDLGSTRFKAAVFDAELNRLGSGSCALTYRHGPNGAVEIEPGHVVDALQTAVKAAMAGFDADALHAIAIDSQAQTFTITDAGFNPVTPFFSWLDTRASAACRALASDESLVDFARHVSFPEPTPALQVCQLGRLYETRPDVRGGDHRVLLLPAYIVARLTGVPVCDTNLAAMSGLYSMQHEAWWPAALAASGLEAYRLPELVPAGALAGRTTSRAAEFGLGADIPVVLAGNDQTAGAYGAGVHERDAVLITLGTCQVAYRAPAGPPEAPRTTAAGPYPGGRWYAMAADVCGGNLINWAETILAGCESDAAFFSAAETASPGCNGLVFEIGLHGDTHAWQGMTTGHTPGDCARAVVETLVRRMAALTKDLCDHSLPDVCLVAGGGSNARLWVALLEQALAHPLTVTQADPLTGAARMARDCLNPV